MKARIKLAVSIAAFAALLAPTVSAGQEIDLVVARDVVDRQPVGESSSFPSDVGALVAWTDITDSPDGAITYTWRHENGLTAITVRISRAPRWRTWSRKAIPDGWTVEAAMGEAVARVSFTIEPE